MEEKPKKPCVACLEDTTESVVVYGNPRIVLFICDSCYYPVSDGVILPVPFGALFGNPSLDQMS